MTLASLGVQLGRLNLGRREFVAWFLAAPVFIEAQSPKEPDPQDPLDWTCPMDPDIHLSKPGKCPRCGMTLVLKVPERVEYGFDVEVEPAVPHPGDEASLTLRAVDPEGNPVAHYAVVHEKLIHLFVVSQDLEFFAHVHPVFDGTAFHIRIRLPRPGMYRLLADYDPAGSVPQLSVATLFVEGHQPAPHLKSLVDPQRCLNLTASLRMEPQSPIAGLETRLFFDLDPYDGLEPYLGAWGHMLIASEDLVDLIHTHPFLVRPPAVQFNVIFPRAGFHRIWTQFQRRGVVNTVEFTVGVHAI